MNQKHSWFLIGAAWMIFIVIDAFVAGVLYVLLNNFYTYIKHGNSTDFQIRLLPAKDIFVGIFFGLYKFSLVPFYWLILFVIVRRNSLILKASLVRTVLYFTGCFLISFAVFAILNISMVSNSTGSVISLWTNPAYGKFVVHSNLLSAFLSAIIWFVVMKSGFWKHNAKE